MRSALIKRGKEVLKAFGFEENSWMNADACTISDNKGLLFWIVFRDSTALAVVFADKTMFQPIHNHFEESLFGEFATIQQKKRKEEKNKDQQKAKVRKNKGEFQGQSGKGSSWLQVRLPTPILHQVCQGGQLISKTKKTT